MARWIGDGIQHWNTVKPWKFCTYRVATCRNPMLKGIPPVSWLYDKSLIRKPTPIQQVLSTHRKSHASKHTCQPICAIITLRHSSKHTCEPMCAFITWLGKSENIQNLKACTVSDIIWNGPCQVVSLNIIAW